METPAARIKSHILIDRRLQDRPMAQTPDDSQLLRMASDPRTRLFTPLRGGTVFGPLVVVAGLVPALAVVLGGELPDVAAGWALRALDVMTADEIRGWLEPGYHGLASSFVDQPPLSSWLLSMLAPLLGTDHLGSWRLLSVVFTGLVIWATYLLGRRVGGASFGLVTTLVVCGHPVMLRLATGTSPAALGILLMVVAVWGFLGHLEGPPQLVSTRMLAGSVAWGFAMLAVGPVALSLCIPMIIHAWLLQEGRHRVTGRSFSARLWQLWLGLRTVTVFIITALSVSGWWLMMMISDHGTGFWMSWWTGQVSLQFPGMPLKSFWRDWLAQNSCLCGLLVIGLMAVIQELRQPSSEIDRRRRQFVLIWWLTALAIRALFDVPTLRGSVMIDAWDAMLLLPTALLVAWGVKAIVLRQTSIITESLLVASTIGLCAWRLSDRAWVGVVALLLSLVVISSLPVVTPRIRRGARAWTERDWRRLLRPLVVLILVTHCLAGMLELKPPSQESRSLADLRQRISGIAPVPRVTLLTINGDAPESLMFVLRSRWPTSQFAVASVRDGKISRESATTPPMELVVEWTRNEARMMNELSADRQATVIGDPLRFRDRRLMIYRVAPRVR